MNQYSDTQSISKGKREESTLKEKEREIPLLLKVMSYTVQENSSIIKTLQERLMCVSRPIQFPEMEDPRPECFTSMGAEFKGILIQLRTNNQLLSCMLEGLEI